jgi:FkbM family methyltransferase
MRIIDAGARRLGRVLQSLGDTMTRRGTLKGTWIDVGAHHGETTLAFAYANPELKIYALEPNLTAAAKLVARAPNYCVLPMAISEQDGYADFYLNSFDAASSLLPMDETVRRSWIGGEVLKEQSVVGVPTLRLDTLMRILEISVVDYLKIDAQGTDLSVIKSAGARLRDVLKIMLEVSVTPKPLYPGAAEKEEVIDFLKRAGFSLTRTEDQTHGQEQNLTFVRN